MKIERLTKASVKQFAPLFDAYRCFYDQKSDIQAAETFLQARFLRNESVIFVAIVEGEFVGFTQLYPTFSSVAMKQAFILNDLYVAETYRRHGIAQQLMEQAFRYATDKEARFLKLETGIINKNAQALYEKMGMIIEQNMKNYIIYFK